MTEDARWTSRLLCQRCQNLHEKPVDVVCYGEYWGKNDFNEPEYKYTCGKCGWDKIDTVYYR